MGLTGFNRARRENAERERLARELREAEQEQEGAINGENPDNESGIKEVGQGTGEKTETASDGDNKPARERKPRQ